MEPGLTVPIITLTTDFGLADHYVGTMKGVVLSRCPNARLVDIGHEIPPFCIISAAYAIDQAARYFPPGTVHLIVVDPGVGTTRRPLLVLANRQYFVAPDNGVLSMIIGREPAWRARELSNRHLWLDTPSSTFHGRDIFAPVAAAIACEATRVEDVGPEVIDIQLLDDIQAKQPNPGYWQGKVLSIDRFGNVITNIQATDVPELGSLQFSLAVNESTITVLKKTFGGVAANVLFAYFGSSGYIEIGMNQESAAKAVNASPGQLVTLRMEL